MAAGPAALSVAGAVADTGVVADDGVGADGGCGSRWRRGCKEVQQGRRKKKNRTRRERGLAPPSPAAEAIRGRDDIAAMRTRSM